MTSVIICIAGIAVLIVLIFIWSYNKITQAENLVESAFGDIDVQLNRRFQLVPNLVATTQAYAKHESEVLLEVAEKRGGTIEKLARQDQSLINAIRQISVAAEAYPDLKAIPTFRQLMQELSLIEDDLRSARRFYNGAVRVYNTAVQSFPGNITAGLFSKKIKPFYTVHDTNEREVQSIEL